VSAKYTLLNFSSTTVTLRFSFFCSLYRNKSSYMVQLINPHQASTVNNNHHQSESSTQSMTSEANKPNDGSVFSIFVILCCYVLLSITENSTGIPLTKRVAQYGVFTALLNSGMILSCSNYDTKAPKGEFCWLVTTLKIFCFC
jgi:hypothetical protein